MGKTEGMTKPTIYANLQARLGRPPTHEEIKTECRRIIAEAYAETATQGRLSHQRKR